MTKRSLKVLALVIGASFLLTACDPPMPPEVKAALAEQSYTCESGNTELAAISPIAAVATDWQASVESNCPGMTISLAQAANPEAELQIGTLDAKSTAYVTVPFAVDAAVIAVSLADITNLNLDAEAISKIWSGQITKWNDPIIAALNPNFTMPATPIVFGTELNASQAKPLTDWLERLSGSAVTIEGGTAKTAAMTDGAVVLTSYSNATALGLQMAGITAKSGVDGVIPEVGSINSAASMFQSKTTAGVVSLNFNAKAKPIAPDGVAVAPAPYQAVEFLNLYLCGTDSLKTRAAARYILRQDSQGSLGLSTVVALPENIRVLALTEVSKGLPEPVITEQPN